MKYFKKVLSMVLVMVLMFSIAPRVNAAEKVTISEAFGNAGGNDQWRFITVVKDPQWTEYKRVSGQPTKGTYLKKGDSLFYYENGGSTGIATFSVGFGAAFGGSVSVSLAVPLGNASTGGVGAALRAPKTGYYIIKAKKYVQPTFTFIQYRYKNATGGWGSWGQPAIYNKSFKEIRREPHLVKVS